MSDLQIDLDALDFTKANGLVGVVCQDASTGAVLMFAYADRDALEQTIRTGEMHYRSRTRGARHKGATSGNTQRVISLHADCDGDSVLARVIPTGPACHTGIESCFGDDTGMAADPLAKLCRTIEHRKAAPTSGSYTNRLLSDRNLRLKKLGEECAELIMACSDGDPAKAAEEGADVFYHTLVALSAVGVTFADVQRVLDARAHYRQTT